MKIKFEGYSISPQYLRTDKSTRITIDVSDDQLDNIEDILMKRLAEGIYTITIEPKMEEID